MANRIIIHGQKELDDFLKGEFDSITAGIRREVMKTAFQIKSEAQRNLDRNKTTDRGTLKKSIVADSDNNWLSAEVGTNSQYGEAVEFGSRPHFPPPQALQEWVKRKVMGIGAHIKGGKKPARAGSSRNREINAIKGLAFVIARAISRKGTPAQPFLGPAAHKHLTKLYNKLKRNLSEGR